MGVLYATVEELRAQPDIARDAHDTTLETLLEAASRAIDAYCNRPDGFVAPAEGGEEPRLFWGSGAPHLYIGDCVAVAEVALRTGGGWVPLDEDAWAAYSGDSRRPSAARPYTGLLRADGGVWARGRVPTVRAAARWGYAETVPPAIKQAAITLAMRWWMRGRTAWSDATASPELGALMYRQEVDPDVRMLLDRGRFVRPAL